MMTHKTTFSIGLGTLALLGGIQACASSPGADNDAGSGADSAIPPSSSSGSGSGAGSSGSGSGGSSSSSQGSSGTGNSSSGIGGSSGNVGSSGSGSSSGVASSSSGGSSGGSSSGSPPAPDGGSGGGSSSGGSGGVDSGVLVDKAVAQVLDGYAMLDPCNAGVDSMYAMKSSPHGYCCCNQPATGTAGQENSHTTKTFGGDPTLTYNVTMRVAGVAEGYWYAGGALDPISKTFYVGGLPTIHNAAATAMGNTACKVHPPTTDSLYALGFTVPPEINPTDGCFNGFNIFAMIVSSPKQVYYFNYTNQISGDRQPHYSFLTDYTATIPIKGGATLDFYVIGGDHHEVANDGLTVPNLKTPQPYIGDFLEFTVMNVTHQ